MVILPNLTYWLGISEVYAVVVTVAFLITGFLLDNWHPGWMLFLTIPLYYVLIRAVRPGALSANSTAARTLGSMEPGAKWPRSM